MKQDERRKRLNFQNPGFSCQARRWLPSLFLPRVDLMSLDQDRKRLDIQNPGFSCQGKAHLSGLFLSRVELLRQEKQGNGSILKILPFPGYLRQEPRWEIQGKLGFSRLLLKSQELFSSGYLQLVPITTLYGSCV